MTYGHFLFLYFLNILKYILYFLNIFIIIVDKSKKCDYDAVQTKAFYPTQLDEMPFLFFIGFVKLVISYLRHTLRYDLVFKVLKMA